jgi:hypothetical protein
MRQKQNSYLLTLASPNTTRAPIIILCFILHGCISSSQSPGYVYSTIHFVSCARAYCTRIFTGLEITLDDARWIIDDPYHNFTKRGGCDAICYLISAAQGLGALLHLWVVQHFLCVYRLVRASWLSHYRERVATGREFCTLYISAQKCLACTCSSGWLD